MRLIAYWLTLATSLLLASCSGDSPPAQSVQQAETPLNQVALKQAASCDELKQKFVDNWVENLLSGQRFLDLQTTVPLNAPTVEVFAADALSGTGAGDAIPDDISQTNVQEAGVDEADSVKTDALGNLYIAQHDRLVVADAFPPQSMNILATLPLDGHVSGIYLAESDNLVAALVSPRLQVLPLPATTAIASYIPWQQKTDLVLIDISDPANPAASKTIRIDGSLVSSRRIGSKLLLVQSIYLNPWIYASSTEVQQILDAYRQAFVADDQIRIEELQAQLHQRILDRLDFDQAEELLPVWQTLVNGVEQQRSQLGCDEVFLPEIDLDHNQLLTVTSVDLGSGDIQHVAAIGSGWITYASENDLFIVQSGLNWWWQRDQHQQSAIHHFSIAGDKPAYVSTGLVKGFVNNAFSLSYYRDHLRVATTQNLWNQADRGDVRSTNHLFVLADNASAGMDVVGAVENYADNERIFSARLLGERGFVVTFRQVDPLFSFDLSDPANPFIAGDLKIPGFSTYMHPIGDNHLLTIGRDGDATGAGDQVAVKLFDVSDLASPVEVDSYSPDLPDGYSWSQAGWDHHAFTYHDPAQMLAVPLSSYNPLADEFFMGILVLNVDVSGGLSLAGRIDHDDLAQQLICDAADPGCDAPFFGWLARPTRSIFMTENTDSYLYSLSNIGVKAVATDALDTTAGSLLLPDPKAFYDFYF